LRIEKLNYSQYFIFALLVFSLANLSSAQIGGDRSLDFVNVPVGASTYALGGQNITTRSLDNNQFWQNPASLDTQFSNTASYSYNSYFAQIRNHSVSYTKSIESIGNFGFGVNYFNYGELNETDEFGTELGIFNSNEYVLNVSYSRIITNFSYGAGLKFANSKIGNFNSNAILFDLGGQFIHPNKDLVVGMTFSNMGFQLSKYNEERFKTPFDLKLGMSFKPQNMPMRLSATVHKLYRYNIDYSDPNQFSNFDENGDPVVEEVSNFEKASQHLVLASEILISKGFNFHVGYNFLKRSELMIEDRKGTVGFSFGFLAKVKSFQIAFGRSIDHISGGTNKLSISTDLSFFTKNRI
jgi:hypothetical protein